VQFFRVTPVSRSASASLIATMMPQEIIQQALSRCGVIEHIAYERGFGGLINEIP